MYAGTTGQGIKGQLFKAVQTGDLDELGRLVTDANINTVDILGQTLAHHAAMLEDQRILEFLAQHGADLNKKAYSEIGRASWRERVCQYV